MGKLVYILSFGHSGSTLLDLVLGTHPSMLSTGELMFLPFNLERSLNAEYPIEDGSRCSCHLKYLDCPIWSKVIERVCEESGGSSMRESPERGFDMSFLRDQDFFARGRLVDRIRKLSLLRLPDWMTRGIKNVKSLENNWRVIDALSDVSGKEYVIDSSKDVFRLLHFLRYRPNDAQVIVNVRSPFGVVNSYSKQGRPASQAVRQWLHYYSSVIRVLNRFGMQPFVVDYGSLCRAPVDMRNRVLTHLGVPNDGLEELVISKGGHHMALGNGMRFQPEIRVRADEAWRESLSSEDKEYVLEYLSKRITVLSDLVSPEQQLKLLSL